jgi:hypothetical protein
MTDHGSLLESEPGEAALICANCRRPLDPTDKFCRECGLPTLRQAVTQRAVPTPPPDVREFQQAMEVAPDPQPFAREGSVLAPYADHGAAAQEADLSTGSVIRATNPTLVTRLAASTLLMVGLIVVFVVVGLALLYLAFRG